MQNEKPGFFERFTKKGAEGGGVQVSHFYIESVLNTTRTSFDEEAARLRREYAEKKGVIIEKVAEERAIIEGLEAEAQVDDSVEVRRA